MYSPDFEYAFKHTFEAEGDFSNYAWDPGGKTKYGITERVWLAWRGENRPSCDIPIEKITPEDAKELYYDEYWMAPRFDTLHDRLITAELFDTGVNCGTVRAIQMLQEAANYLRKPDWSAIVTDGKLGPVTRFTVRRLVLQGYRTGLLRAMNGEQYIHYKRIGNQHAARGWAKRLAPNEVET